MGKFPAARSRGALRGGLSLGVKPGQVVAEVLRHFPTRLRLDRSPQENLLLQPKPGQREDQSPRPRDTPHLPPPGTVNMS